MKTLGANRRLLVAAVVGSIAAAAASSVAPWQVAALLGWAGAAVAFLALAARVISLDAGQTQALARSEDPSALAADVTLIVAAAASLVGVGMVLQKASDAYGGSKLLFTLLGVVSVALAWTVVQTIYTLRYARLYYDAATPVGIDFNNEEPPDYHDFAYLAFTVGMTYQVSDTNITSRTVRRAVLRHALLSFGFATAFIAVLINVVGGLF